MPAVSHTHLVDVPLARIADCVRSQLRAASGGAERDHKNTKHIWPKARNRLEIEKLKKLKHRFSSLRLKEGTLSSDAVDPEKEMITVRVIRG